MGVLTKRQIENRTNNGELLRNPRKDDNGQLDIEADSYDLAAGTVIWKEPGTKRDEQRVITLSHDPSLSRSEQPTISVQPGQMVFIVTLEDVLMPPDLCGTVYSRNNLALRGILALNAGHVDSGYEGPIAIRLINLRATPWTLSLGEPIFTIAFQTLDEEPESSTAAGRQESQDSMIARVRDTADSALSNALYDLYASEMERRLHEYRANTLAELQRDGDKRWVQIDRMWAVLFNSGWKKLVGIALTLSTVAAGVAGVTYIISLFTDKF